MASDYTSAIETYTSGVGTRSNVTLFSNKKIGFFTGYAGYYMEAYGTLTAGTISRSGNTVTFSNCTYTGWFTNLETSPTIYRSSYSCAAGIYYNGSLVWTSSTYAYGWYNRYVYDGTSLFSFSGFSFSITVGSSATSVTLGATSDTGDGQQLAFSVAIPNYRTHIYAKTYKSLSGGEVEYSSEVGTFDFYLTASSSGVEGLNYANQTSVDFWVEPYRTEYGTLTYMVKGITEASGYYYTGDISAYTGSVSDSAIGIGLYFMETVAPTCDITLMERTYNSVTVKNVVSDYGVPDQEEGRYTEVGVGPYNSTAYTGTPHRFTYKTQANQETMTYTFQGDSSTLPNYSANTDSTYDYIAGCAALKIGGYASNTYLVSGVWLSDVFYLPPAPLTTAELTGVSSAGVARTKKFGIKMQGGAIDNVSNVSYAMVYNQYRISVDGGTTWSDWTNLQSDAVSPADTLETEISYTYPSTGTFLTTIQVRQANAEDTEQATDAVTITSFSIAISSLYIGNSENKSVAIQKLYVGDSNNTARLITPMYISTGGISVKVHE